MGNYKYSLFHSTITAKYTLKSNQMTLQSNNSISIFQRTPSHQYQQLQSLMITNHK
jgi:hypothetical protein